MFQLRIRIYTVVQKKGICRQIMKTPCDGNLLLLAKKSSRKKNIHIKSYKFREKLHSSR